MNIPIDHKFVRRIEPGQEIRCDACYVTDDRVMIRIDGRWVEVRPFLHSRAQMVGANNGRR